VDVGVTLWLHDKRDPIKLRLGAYGSPNFYVTVCLNAT
jgi:hypothetical protein